MRLIYMGTPDFAVPALEALSRSGREIVSVVTQPDRRGGRGRTLLPPPVKECALALGIPVLQPEKVRDGDFIETLRSLHPDCIIVAAFGQIIPEEILEIPPFGCLNIHASLLPKYRGASPVQRAVMEGEKESGVTLMRMDRGLDTGDIIAQKVVPLSADETGGSLFDRLSIAGAELLIETLPSVFDGTAVYTKQPKESPTPYASMITREMGILDFGESAEKLERLVRGLDPWPGASAYLNGKNLKIYKSSVTKGSGEPGVILEAGHAGIAVACGEDALLLTEVQLEGKKRMDAASFLRGYQLKAGMRLTSLR